MSTKTIEVEFFVSTMYIGSEVSEIVEIEVDEDDLKDKDYLNEVISEYHEDWLINNYSAGWNIKTDIE